MPDTEDRDGTRTVVNLTKDPRCPGIGCPRFGCDACKRAGVPATVAPAAGPGVTLPAKSKGRGQEKKNDKKEPERGGADGRVRSRSPAPKEEKLKPKAKAQGEKAKVVAPPPIRPEMEPTPEGGWTAHNLEVRRQYTAYLELEIVGGSMGREEVDGFLPDITQLVESNDGEAKRKAAEDAAAAAAQKTALSQREMLQQQSIKESFNVCKGKGKANSQFPSTAPPYRHNGIPQSASTSEAVPAITALAARARDSADKEQQQVLAAVTP